MQGLGFGVSWVPFKGKGCFKGIYKGSFKGFLLKGSKVSIRVYRVPFKGIYKGCFKRIYREYYEGSTGVTRGL